MKQLSAVDSQQTHFRFVKSPKVSQQSLAAGPYSPAPSVVVSYGASPYSVRPPPLLPIRAAPIPLPSLPPLSKQLDDIEGMQGRYKFAPERDALYAGQGFRQAAQDVYDGVYPPQAFAAAQSAAPDSPQADSDGDAVQEPAPAPARRGGRAHLGANLAILAGDESGGGKKSGRAHVEDGGSGESKPKKKSGRAHVPVADGGEPKKPKKKSGRAHVASATVQAPAPRPSPQHIRPPPQRPIPQPHFLSQVSVCFDPLAVSRRRLPTRPANLGGLAHG